MSRNGGSRMGRNAARGVRMSGRGMFSRRQFLKLGGAGLAGVTLLGAAGCGGDQQEGDGPVQLVFSHGPEESGVLRQQLDEFNQQREGEIQVEWREMPADSGQYFDQLRTEFQAGGGEIDVVSGDVIWPAQFGANGWVLDLSDRFTEGMRGEHLDGSVEAVTWDGRVWGVPWFTNAGLLYYRQDLLEEAGFSQPPETWDELKEMALKTAQDTNTQFGFVFQGADYEGGVVNGLEYIWTHGGDVLSEDGSEVVIDSPESVEALTTQRSMIDDGVTAEAISSYKEQESQAAFLRGDAVFMRNWPYVYGLVGTEGESSIEHEQVGIAALPVASEDIQTYSCLGGWNLFINASSQNPDAAWELIQFLSAPEQSKGRALEGSYLPTVRELYEDQEIQEEVPVTELGREAIENTRPRPVSPYYSDMSLAMGAQFNAALRGDTTPEQAVANLQEEMSGMLERADEA